MNDESAREGRSQPATKHSTHSVTTQADTRRQPSRSHLNNLPPWEEHRWAKSLADVEHERADQHPPTEAAMPRSPWTPDADEEFTDVLVEQGRL